MNYTVVAFGLLALAFVAALVPVAWAGWDWMSNPLVVARGLASFVGFMGWTTLRFYAEAGAFDDAFAFAYLFASVALVIGFNVFDVRTRRRGLSRMLDTGKPLPRGVAADDVRRWAESHPLRGIEGPHVKSNKVAAAAMAASALLAIAGFVLLLSTQQRAVILVAGVTAMIGVLVASLLLIVHGGTFVRVFSAAYLLGWLLVGTVVFWAPGAIHTYFWPVVALFVGHEAMAGVMIGFAAATALRLWRDGDSQSAGITIEQAHSAERREID
jgi:hypothetical protein